MIVLIINLLQVQVNIYAREVSVLMPGEENPTFIANPVPSVCHP